MTFSMTDDLKENLEPLQLKGQAHLAMVAIAMLVLWVIPLGFAPDVVVMI